MISLDKVHLAYTVGNRPVPVLAGASLDIEQGQSLAIIGPSGSGKTSLLLILTGLETPNSGSVVFDGEPLHKLSSDARADLRRDRIGIVFQNFHLVPSLTARENVALPLELPVDQVLVKWLNSCWNVLVWGTVWITIPMPCLAGSANESLSHVP